MEDKILKYSEYTTEAAFKPNENGELELQDYEVYPDEHPQKFIYEFSEKKPLYEESEKVWVVKYKDNIIATFSDDIDVEKLDTIVENLKSKLEDNIEDNPKK